MKQKLTVRYFLTKYKKKQLTGYQFSGSWFLTLILNDAIGNSIFSQKGDILLIRGGWLLITHPSQMLYYLKNRKVRLIGNFMDKMKRWSCLEY